MARLARVHFAGLGTDSARFNPVTLDFRDAQGKPGHAVMWLRNGGGKTTMLSFLYSTLRPHYNDWLGRHNGRQTELLEYVKERQTGFVLLEFEFPHLGVRRIVGQAISKRTSREQKRVFFTFRADGALPWEQIPVTGLGPAAGSIDLFFERVKEFGGHAGNPLELYATERQEAWRAHLDSIGLDPEVYHTHLLMNADEGGLLNFFDFDSPEAFVEKLLNMAFETLRPLEEPGEKPAKEDLTLLIEKFRQKVFGRPNLDATAAFCQHALAALETLKTELDVVTQFRQQREGYRGQAAQFLVATERHLSGLRTDVDNLGKEKDVSVKAKRENTNRKEEHRKFQRHYDRRRKLLLISEAEAEVKRAEAKRTQEDQWLAALRAAHRQRRLTDCDMLIADFTRQKHEREKAHAPDRQVLEQIGHSLVQLLTRRIGEIRDRLVRWQGERQQTLTELGDLQKELVQVASMIAGANTALANVQSFLRDADRERQRLREQGFLLAGTETGAEGVKRWQALVQSHQDTASRLGIEITNTDARLTAVRNQEREKQQQRGTITAEIARLTAWVETMNTSASRLRADPIIARETGESPTADLSSPPLDAALARFADDCHRALLAKTVEGAADRRIVEHARNHPNTTFPPPVGIELLLEKLRGAGVTSAIPAYRWLSENCEAGEAAHRLLAQPALYAGIVVQVPSQLLAARGVLVAEGLDLPVLIGTPADFAEVVANTPHHVVLPEEKGFFNAALAQINLARVANHAARRETEMGQLILDQKATDGVLARLREHVRAYPAKTVDEKHAELSAQQQLLVAHDAALGELARETATLADRLRELRSKKEGHERDAGHAQIQLVRVQAFVTNYEGKVPAKREEERGLIDAIQAARDREGAIGNRLTTLREELPPLEGRISQAGLDRQELELKKAAVPAQYVGTVPLVDAGDDLGILAERFAAKRLEYEGRVQPGYFDAKVEEQQRQKAEIESEQRRDPARPAEADIALALEEVDLAACRTSESGNSVSEERFKVQRGAGGWHSGEASCFEVGQSGSFGRLGG